MSSLSDRIMRYVGGFPEGQVFRPRNFLHMGNRNTVDQALYRLVSKGSMIRIFQGGYVRAIDTPSGRRSPDLEKVLDSLRRLWMRPVVLSGAFAAHSLGLTDHAPSQLTYLTSGPDRLLSLGDLEVDVRHAPPWQLVAPGRLAGSIIRALAFLGPEKTETALNSIVPNLSEEERADLLSMRSRVPMWIVQPLSAFVKRD